MRRGRGELDDVHIDNTRCSLLGDWHAHDKVAFGLLVRGMVVEGERSPGRVDVGVGENRYDLAETALLR